MSQHNVGWFFRWVLDFVFCIKLLLTLQLAWQFFSLELCHLSLSAECANPCLRWWWGGKRALAELLVNQLVHSSNVGISKVSYLPEPTWGWFGWVTQHPIFWPWKWQQELFRTMNHKIGCLAACFWGGIGQNWMPQIAGCHWMISQWLMLNMTNISGPLQWVKTRPGWPTIESGANPRIHSGRSYRLVRGTVSRASSLQIISDGQASKFDACSTWLDLIESWNKSSTGTRFVPSKSSLSTTKPPWHGDPQW